MEINLDKKQLKSAFFLSLVFTLTIPSLFANVRLFYFAPFLIISMYQSSLTKTLWLGFLCGLILDLLSSSSRLGIYAMSFCLTVFAIYPQKKNFFADSISTLPIMTYAFSSISTVATAIILYLIDMHNMFSWPWVVTDVLIMPAADALYAFTIFTLPAMLIGKPIRPGKDYFLSRD